ncbi:MAG: MliC family protein [Alsobacter sp.]
MARRVQSAALALLTAALALSAATLAFATQARFRCDDGTRLTASFSGGAESPGSVVLRFAGGRMLTLPQVPSADGGRYQAGAAEFWTKGQGATLTQGGKATTCRVHRR